MVNIVDIPILKKKFVVLIIGIIIGFFIFRFINSNYPSFLNCKSNTTEKFSYDNAENQNNAPNDKTELVSQTGLMTNGACLMMGCPMAAGACPMAAGACPMAAGAGPMAAGAGPMAAGACPMAAGAGPMAAGVDLMVNDPISQIPNGYSESDSYATITVPIISPPPSMPIKPLPTDSNNLPVPNISTDSYAPVESSALHSVVQSQQLVNNSASIKLYNFNTSWCGWSKKFQPEWDTFMNNVSSDSKLNGLVEVKDVKCDNGANKQLCEDNDIEGYPTVLIDVKGVKTVYDGPRTANGLMNKVNQLLSNM